MKIAIVSEGGHDPHIAVAVNEPVGSCGIVLAVLKTIGIRHYRRSKVRWTAAVRVAPVHQILGISHHRGKTPSQVLLLLHIAAKNPECTIFIGNTRIMNSVDVVRLPRDMRTAIAVSLIRRTDLLEISAVIRHIHRIGAV